jgi:hypothetical protein
MKVTANIPDALIDEVRQLAGKPTITESLIVALEEWIALKRVRELNAQVRERGLEFKKGYSAASIRKLNRQR